MARRLVPKADGKGYTRESRQSSLIRTSNEMFLSMMSKNEVEKNRYKSTVGHIAKENKQARIITSRDLDTVKDDYTRMRAYEQVYKLHSFENYDPLRSKKREAESAKKIKQIGEPKSKISLPNLMFKALKNRANKNIGNELALVGRRDNSSLSNTDSKQRINAHVRNTETKSREISNSAAPLVLPQPPNKETTSQDKIGSFRMRRLMPNMNKQEYDTRRARRRRTKETKIWVNSNSPRRRIPENLLPPPVPPSKHKVVIVCHEDLVKERNMAKEAPSVNPVGPLQTIKEESFVADDNSSRHDTPKFDKNALPETVVEKNDHFDGDTLKVITSNNIEGECRDPTKKPEDKETKKIKAPESLPIVGLPPLPPSTTSREERFPSSGEDPNSVWKLSFGLQSLMLWRKSVQQRRQRQDKPKSEPPRASWRTALETKTRPKSYLPGECTTAYSLKKYMQREITNVIDAWSPNSRRQGMIEDIRDKKRVFSAGYRDNNSSGIRDISSRTSFGKESIISDQSQSSMDNTLKSEVEIEELNDFKFLKGEEERKEWSAFLGKVRQENLAKKRAQYNEPQPKRFFSRTSTFNSPRNSTFIT